MAPVAALMLVQAVAGLDRLRAWQWRGRRAGHWLAGATIAICLLGYAVPLCRTLARGDRTSPRDQILDRLEAEGGRHLIFVRVCPNHDCHQEWVYNRADIDRASVVWAREISPADGRPAAPIPCGPQGLVVGGRREAAATDALRRSARRRDSAPQPLHPLIACAAGRSMLGHGGRGPRPCPWRSAS